MTIYGYFRQSKENGDTETISEEMWRERARECTLDADLAFDVGRFTTDFYWYWIDRD